MLVKTLPKNYVEIREIKALLRKNSSPVSVIDVSGGFLPLDAVAAFRCSVHGPFQEKPSIVKYREEKYPQHGCGKCYLAMIGSRNVVKTVDEEFFFRLIEKAKMTYLDKRLPTLTDSALFRCEHGHIVRTRGKEIQTHLANGDKSACAECLAKRLSCYESRIENNRLEANKVLAANPHWKIIGLVPARKNTTIELDCERHGVVRLTLREFLERKDQCPGCYQGDNPNISPLENWLNRNTKWRGKYV